MLAGPGKVFFLEEVRDGYLQESQSSLKALQAPFCCCCMCSRPHLMKKDVALSWRLFSQITCGSDHAPSCWGSSSGKFDTAQCYFVSRQFLSQSPLGQVQLREEGSVRRYKPGSLPRKIKNILVTQLKWHTQTHTSALDMRSHTGTGSVGLALSLILSATLGVSGRGFQRSCATLCVVIVVVTFFQWILPYSVHTGHVHPCWHN